MKTQILILITLASMALFSCQDFNGINNSNTGEDLVLKSANIAVSDLSTESVMDEANLEADFFANSEKLLRQLTHFKGTKNILGGRDGMHYLKDNCPNVSIDTADVSYPIIITLDYGESTVLKNGRTISGIVSIEISAPKGTDGSTRTISYDNCVIDSISIAGTAIEVFNGDNITTRVITRTSDVSFTLADGTVIDRVGTHVREWVAGMDTPMERDDDQIVSTGSTTASSSTGENWERLIIEPLVRLGDCRYNVQGIVQFSSNGVVISTLNFGDGECDNLAILTSDGEDVEIELTGKKPEAKLDKHKTQEKNKGKH
ncbi:MAG: hypothetical protein ACERKD_00270 [Prolixibacteraceae bacterium]